MSWLDRILNRSPSRKAVSGGPWLTAYQTGTPLSSLSSDPRDRMAKYLQAYRVGWFHKAGRKIATDVAGLDIVLAYEDSEGDNEDDIVSPASNVPFGALTPLEQFLRLMERPNPAQTGKQLRAKTQIRLDFAGAAFWYLENGDGGQLPTAIYGLSPTRMDPSLDKSGNLLGWVMDKGLNGSPGIPFTTDEIVLFSTTSSDDAWYGVSIVEAVYSQVPLTDLIARHTADVLTTGGRLAGMMWPKERALDEAEFQDAARAWRNVASDPNAARRLLLFPEPMEYAPGAATPKDIGIPELAELNREEITTAFPVNPYMLGLPLEPGMNSGDSLKYVQRDYWANSIHDRGELLEETIQVRLLPRYEEAVGRPLDFDLEEPQLDDAVALVEKAGAMRALVALGFDPKDTVDKVGLDHIKWVGVPEPEPVAAQQPAPGAEGPSVTVNDTSRLDSVNTTQTLAKAVKARREEVVGEVLPGFVPTMSQFFADQRDRLVAGVEREFTGLTKAQRKALPAGWWDADLEDALLRDSLNSLYVTLSRTALTVVADDVNRIVTKTAISRVTEKMLANAAERITGINEATRDAATKTLAVGVQRGYTVGQLVNGFPKEDFLGLRDLRDPDTGKAMFDAYRSELVARTETMRAYNESALLGYQEYNVREVVASDGDYDHECEVRNGRAYPVEEALGIEDHPNGTLDWVPVVPELRKSVDVAPDPGLDILADITRQALELAAARQQVPPPPEYRPPEYHPAPDVRVDAPITVNPPEVTLKVPDVIVNVPEQAPPIVNPTPVNVAAPDLGPLAESITRLTEAQAAMAAQLAALTRPTRRVVERDANNKIIGIREEPAA